MNTMKVKGQFNLELTNHEVMVWEYHDHAPDHPYPPLLRRIMGIETVPGQREIPLAKPSWTIKELAVTVDMHQSASVSNDAPNTLAHWANTRYEDSPDSWYHHVEVECFKADYAVRTITFPHAYVKRYEEAVDSEAGTWIATILLGQKQDMTSKVMVNGKAVSTTTEQLDYSLNKPHLNKKEVSSNIMHKIIDTEGQRNEIPLTQEQIKELVDYAKRLGFPEDRIYICSPDQDYPTGIFYGTLFINNDVLPSPNPSPNIKNNANALVSGKGTIAHEIVGHIETMEKGTAFKTFDDSTVPVEVYPENEALNEAQASIRAARFAPELTIDERHILMRDGLNRLKNEGIKLKDVRHLLDINER